MSAQQGIAGYGGVIGVSGPSGLCSQSFISGATGCSGLATTKLKNGESSIDFEYYSGCKLKIKGSVKECALIPLKEAINLNKSYTNYGSQPKYISLGPFTFDTQNSFKASIQSHLYIDKEEVAPLLEELDNLMKLHSFL